MCADAGGKPHILVIDDEPISMVLGAGGESRTLQPEDVRIGDLAWADLVVVDNYLDDWPEREALGDRIARKPLTGLALAAVLREHVDLSGKLTGKLTAFAIQTGRLEQLRGRLREPAAPHLLARCNNLEWVFSKSEARRDEQMLLLAAAVRLIPQEWPEDGEEAEDKLRSLLELTGDEDWFGRCWHEVLACHAPIHELRNPDSHGLMLLRWLLHDIMPHPCFLSEIHWVAARLQLPVNDLQAIMVDGTSELANQLGSLEYKGLLVGFLGRRWWRGALEDYVWDLLGGGAASAQKLHAALQELAGRELGVIEANPAVVCLDADLQPERIVSALEAVRLRPDTWPAYADAAWTTIARANEEASLRAIVDPLDLGRLDDGDEA